MIYLFTFPLHLINRVVLVVVFWWEFVIYFSSQSKPNYRKNKIHSWREASRGKKREGGVWERDGARVRQWLRHVHDHSRVVRLRRRGCSSHERTAGEDGKTGASVRVMDTLAVASVIIVPVQTPPMFFLEASVLVCLSVLLLFVIWCYCFF